MCMCVSCSIMSDSLQLPGLYPDSLLIHGLLQARILEWVVVPSSRGSSQPRDWTWVSCIAGRFFTISATKEALSGCSFQFRSVQFSHSVVSMTEPCDRLTPWSIARQASLSITKSQSPPGTESIESVMPSNHLILRHPLLLLPSLFPSTTVFLNQSADWCHQSHQVAKVLEFKLQHQSFQWTPRTDLL